MIFATSLKETSLRKRVKDYLMRTIELSVGSSICLYAIMVLVSTGSMAMAYRYDRTEKKYSARTWLLLTVIIISIPSFFRYYVGIDYANYYRVAERLMSYHSLSGAMSLGGRLESSYALLSYFFDRLGMGPGVLIGFYGLLTQIIMISGIWSLREKVNPTVQTFVYMTYFYFRTYNMARQALSVIIVYYGIHFLLNKKYWKFAICVLVATVFHRTSIISILMIWYFRPARNLKRITNLILCYFVPAVMAFAYEYFMSIVSRLPVFSVYVNDTLKYTTFTNESFLSLGTLLLIVEVFLYIQHRAMYKNEDNEEFYSGLLDKAMFCQVLSFALGMSAGNASRIVLYFSFPAMISLSHMFNTKSYDVDGIAFRFRATNIYQIFVVLYSIAMFLRIMINNGFGQLPFRFWY